MPRDFVIIDTNIWQFALAKPKEKELDQLHESAKEFLFSIINDQTIRIGISTYQVGEILEVLRKTGISWEDRSRIFDDFRKPKFYIKELSMDDTIASANDSAKSNIHVYDYMVVYPLKDIVYRIYSADEHLMHEDFRSICEVINPVSPWSQTEGKRPEKRY